MSYIVCESEEGSEYKSHNHCKNKYFWLDECDVTTKLGNSKEGS